MSKKSKIIIFIIFIVFLIAMSIISIIQKKDNGNNPDNQIAGKLLTNNNIIGKWYSDRDDSDILTLNEDGTYTSSSWLAAGKYTVNNDSILLTDIFGSTKNLSMISHDKLNTLVFSNSSYTYTYYRTSEEAKLGKEEIERNKIEKEEMYSAALMQILTTGEWTNRMGDTTLTFTEDSFTANFISGLGADHDYIETVYYTINDVSVSVKNQNHIIYSIKWKATFPKRRNISLDGNAQIVIKNNNEYSISSNSFPCYNIYYKKADIIFTQDSNKDNIQSLNQNKKVTKSGTDTTTVIEDTNFDDSEFQTAMLKKVEQEIYGTWKGTFEDMPNENTIYSVFTFFEDGTYTFTNGNNSEKGYFSLSHIPGEKYHSVLHLKTDEATKNEKFYFSGSSPIQMTLEDKTHPRYVKQ